MGLVSGKLRIVGLVVLVLGGGAGAVWGGKHWSQSRAERDALAKLTKGDAKDMQAGLLALSKEDLTGPEAAATRRKAMDNMRKLSFEEMMKARESEENLTEEQRKQLRENFGELMRGYMDDRVNEYFNAPKEEKEKILDQQIDEMEKMRKEWEAYREKHKDDPEDKKREERRRQEGGPKRDTQDAKARMEGGNPDQQAKMMYYFGQMRARAEARGIEMGGGRGGFGFWGGGGRRGGSGGPPGSAGGRTSTGGRL